MLVQDSAYSTSYSLHQPLAIQSQKGTPIAGRHSKLTDSKRMDNSDMYEHIRMLAEEDHKEEQQVHKEEHMFLDGWDMHVLDNSPNCDCFVSGTK